MCKIPIEIPPSGFGNFLNELAPTEKKPKEVLNQQESLEITEIELIFPALYGKVLRSYHTDGEFIRVKLSSSASKRPPEPFSHALFIVPIINPP